MEKAAAKREHDVVSFRFRGIDREKLESLKRYIEAQAGPGVIIRDPDVVRYALHTCCAALLPTTEDRAGGS